MTKLDIQKTVQKVQDQNDFADLVNLIPYAKTIGIEIQRFGDDVLFRLPKRKSNLGNPILPAIHGGVISGFMEHSALLSLIMFMDTPVLPKIVDFSIDFLRAGHDKDTFVECEIARQGRRVANVAITAWQVKRTEPIATARAHFLLG